MPALWTRMSAPPIFSTSTFRFSMSAGAAMSQRTLSGSPPSARISSSVSLESTMSAITTRAPSAERRRAYSRPIPSAAPVTTATRCEDPLDSLIRGASPSARRGRRDAVLAPGSGARGEHDLSEVVLRGELLFRDADLGQREGAVHHRVEAAFVDQLDQSLEVG